jgi:hypothetical protein
MKSRHISYQPVDAISDRHKAILTNFLKGQTSYIKFSSTLGWTIKENGHLSMYRANASGIRSNKESELIPPHNVLRISTFGDSYTHCDGVRNDETWQVLLEKLDARLEVLNFGVGGFGLDQAYLRYLEHGSQFKPHMVFIGYMSENIFRHVNTFRPFYYAGTGTPLAKPRFAVKADEKLALIPNMFSNVSDYNVLLSEPKKILSELGVNDYYYPNRYSSSVFDFSPIKKNQTVFASPFVF